jgi:hypothetical protein
MIARGRAGPDWSLLNSECLKLNVCGIMGGREKAGRDGEGRVVETMEFGSTVFAKGGFKGGREEE